MGKTKQAEGRELKGAGSGRWMLEKQLLKKILLCGQKRGSKFVGWPQRARSMGTYGRGVIVDPHRLPSTPGLPGPTTRHPFSITSQEASLRIKVRLGLRGHLGPGLE